MNLADFLLARIAEDEAEARNREEQWFDEGPFTVDRVLAECDAKRRIVEVAEGMYDGGRYPTTADRILRLLALPYADHPDYREDWRP